MIRECAKRLCKFLLKRLLGKFIPGDLDLDRLDVQFSKSISFLQLSNLPLDVEYINEQDIELHLKGVETTGVYGWNSLSEIVVGNWLEDIAHNQVRNVLEGVAPIRSLLALVCGVSKLVSVPAEHYRKDHPVISRLQRGL